MENKEIYNFLRKKIPGLSENNLIGFAEKWNIKKNFKRNEISNLSENEIYFIKKGAVKIFTEILSFLESRNQFSIVAIKINIVYLITVNLFQLC